jgi:membrane dipeptidase
MTQADATIADMLVWDNHACMPLRPHDRSFLPQLERHRASGTNVVMLNVGDGDHAIEANVRMLASFRDWIAHHADAYRLIEDIEDIDDARRNGQLAIGFDIEGANAIGDQLDLLRVYRDLGVRWMLLAYNRNNRAGGGCQDDDPGLTPFGRAMLEEMAALGIVACCSHTGYRTAREAIDSSPTPVIFSHSNPRALRDHPRNIPDDLMRACAERGGVIGINGIGIFLGDNDASVENFVRHVLYTIDLVGIEHVGIGLDFVHDRQEVDEVVAANPQLFPPHLGYARGIEMMPPEQLPAVAVALRERGLDAAALAAVLGGNWMRIARQVWKPRTIRNRT